MTQVQLFLNAVLALSKFHHPDIRPTDADIDTLKTIFENTYAGPKSVILQPLVVGVEATELDVELDSYFNRYLTIFEVPIGFKPVRVIVEIPVEQPNIGHSTIIMVWYESETTERVGITYVVPAFNAPTINFVNYVPPKMDGTGVISLVKRWVQPAMPEGATSMHVIVRDDDEMFHLLTDFFPSNYITKRVDVAFSGQFLELLAHEEGSSTVMRVTITEGTPEVPYVFVTLD